MRSRAVRGAVVALASACSPSARCRACAMRAAQPGRPRYGRPALARDPRPGALRVFAVQFEQQPAQMVSAASFQRAIECVMRIEVAPYLARGRPSLVVFDEDLGLETLATLSALGRRL